MKTYIIILSSITHAYAARDILYKYGVKCYVERLPDGVRKSGCGYGIKLYEYVDRAKEILESHSIRVHEIITL